MTLKPSDLRLASRLMEDTVYVYLAPVDSEEGWEEIARIKRPYADMVYDQWIELLRSLTGKIAEQQGPLAVLVEKPREERA